MDQPMVISFDPAGPVNALHRDEFTLDFLGARTITRASDIRFDEQTQLWDVWLPEAPGSQNFFRVEEAAGFPSYNAAREFEVQWLDACLLAGVDAFEDLGRSIASQIRHR